MATAATACTTPEDRPQISVTPTRTSAAGQQTVQLGQWAASTSSDVTLTAELQAGSQFRVGSDAALTSWGYTDGSGQVFSVSPSGPVTDASVSFDLGAPVPEGQSVVLLSAAEPGAPWESHVTTLSPDRRRASTRASHFSNWTDVYSSVQFGINDLFGQRGNPPACDGAVPSWVDSVNYLDDVNGPQLYCVGHDPARTDLIVVKIANNRGYSQWVVPEVTPAWTWSSAWNVFDIAQSFDRYAAGLWRAPPGAILMPAHSEVHLAFSEATARKVKAGAPTVTVSATPSSYFASLIADQVKKVVGDAGGTLALTLGVILASKCVVDLAAGQSFEDVIGAIRDCVVENRETAYMVAAEISANMLKDENLTRLAATKAVQVNNLILAIEFGKVAISLQEFNQQPEITASVPGIAVLPKPSRATPRPSLPGVPARFPGLPLRGGYACGFLPPVAPGLSELPVRVTSGRLTCAAALSVAKTYIQTSRAQSARGVAFDNWECGMNPVSGSSATDNMYCRSADDSLTIGAG